MTLPAHTFRPSLPGVPWFRTPFVMSFNDDNVNGGGSGGDASQDGGDGGAGADSNAGSGEDKTRTLTDREIGGITGRAERKGREAAIAELSDDLGVPMEEAKKIIAAHREAEDARKTEAERERDEERRKANEAASSAADTKRELMQLRARTALKEAGMDAAAAKLVSADALGITPDSSEQEILDAVARTKTETPGLFSGDGGGDPPPPPAGGNVNRVRKPSGDNKSREDQIQSRAEQLARRRGMTTKTALNKT